jgi:hypothetical protein
VLSPRLSNCYINDLYKVIKFCRFHDYADDVQLLFECEINDINNAIDLENKDINVWGNACSV